MNDRQKAFEAYRQELRDNVLRPMVSVRRPNRSNRSNRSRLIGCLVSWIVGGLAGLYLGHLLLEVLR